MSDNLSLIPMNDFTGDKQAADKIREIADMVESGDVRDIVVVYNNRTGRCFEQFGHFSDRWQILGALEYAKTGVHNTP